MKKFIIENTQGAVLGTFSAQSEEDALDVMARDAGYADYADLQREVPAKEGEIVVTEVDVHFTFDIDVDTLGDGSNWNPYISLALLPDGECQVHVGETQFNTAPINGDAIFFVSHVLQMCEIETTEAQVAHAFKHFSHKLGVLLAQYEGTGMVNTPEQLEEQIKDTMRDIGAWAVEVSEDEEDHDDLMGLDDKFQHGGRDDENTDWL